MESDAELTLMRQGLLNKIIQRLMNKAVIIVKEDDIEELFNVLLSLNPDLALQVICVFPV